MMYRLFMGLNFYPSGGALDYKSQYDTVEKAIWTVNGLLAAGYQYDWFQVAKDDENLTVVAFGNPSRLGGTSDDFPKAIEYKRDGEGIWKIPPPPDIRSIIEQVYDDAETTPNDALAREELYLALSSAMNRLEVERHIADFKVVVDASNNPPDAISGRVNAMVAWRLPDGKDQFWAQGQPKYVQSFSRSWFTVEAYTKG